MRVPTAKSLRHRFVQDESGATAIEYAMIAAGMSIAILTGLQLLGTKIMSAFYDSLTNLF